MRIITFRYNKNNSALIQNKNTDADDSLATTKGREMSLLTTQYTDRLLWEKAETLLLKQTSEYDILGSWQ